MAPDEPTMSIRAGVGVDGFERLDGLDQDSRDELRDTLDELIRAKEALDKLSGGRSTVAAKGRVARAQACYVAALDRLRRAPLPTSASLFDPPSRHAVQTLRQLQRFIQRGIDDETVRSSDEYVSAYGEMMEAAKEVLDPEVVELGTIAPPAVMSFEEELRNFITPHPMPVSPGLDFEEAAAAEARVTNDVSQLCFDTIDLSAELRRLEQTTGATYEDASMVDGMMAGTTDGRDNGGVVREE